jgi:molybdate transport system substrate-binding protein
MLRPPQFIRLAAAALVGAAVLVAPLPARSAAGGGDVIVFAAASLKTALDDITAKWTRTSGHEVKVSYAGSSRLAKQIEYGAPADIFISANAQWMDALQARGALAPGTRRDLLTNRLVLIAHGTDAAALEIKDGFDLAGRLGSDRLAMAMVGAVPAGIYGKAALTALGVWEAVAPKIAQADNVRAALALVERGEAPYGIVYATDAAASDTVSVVGRFPAKTHPAIVYPAALVGGRENNTAARAFFDFLSTKAARSIFQRHGFGVPGGDGVKAAGGAG